jgi:phosphatidylglycerol:prolipoprotein diacylglycerol transferase
MVADRVFESSMIPWFEVPVLHLWIVSADLPSLLAIGGALVAMAMVRYGATRADLSPRRALDGLVFLVLCGLLFGHVAEVAIYHADAMRADPRLLLPWRGGFYSLGAFLGVAVGVPIAFRGPGRGLRWEYLDVLVPAALLGAGIVRLGCFAGHHHAGRLTSFPLAVLYPGGARFDLGLCEAILLFALVLANAVFGKRWRATAGRAAVSLCLGYAVGRLVVELLRGDDIELLGRRSDARYWGLTLVQYATLALAMLGAYWLWRHRHRYNRSTLGARD